FIVDRIRHRRPGPRALLALLDIEGAPLRPLVDHLVVQHEAALLADELAAFIVERKVAGVALRASSDFFGLFDLLGWHDFPQRQTRRFRSRTGRRVRATGPRRRAPGPVRTP